MCCKESYALTLMPMVFPSADGTPTSDNLSKIMWSSVGVGLLLIVAAALVIFKWRRRKKRKTNHPVNNEVSRDFSRFLFLFARFLLLSLFCFVLFCFVFEGRQIQLPECSLIIYLLTCPPPPLPVAIYNKNRSTVQQFSS